MPRQRLVDKARAEQSQAADALKMHLDATRPKARRTPAKTIRADVEEMARTNKWDRAKPRHLAELFVIGHTMVYGIEPGDLTDRGAAAQRARLGIVSAADRMLRQEFGDRQIEMVRYLGWVWKREQEREKWRKENGREGGRLTWQHVIAGRAVLTDYRAAKLRAK